MKKLLLTTIFLLTSAILAAVTVQPEQTKISAPAKFRKEAEILQEHLFLITGRKIPVVQENENGTFTFLFSETMNNGKTPELGECVREITTSSVRISGRGKGAMMAALGAFLEEELGVRWVFANDIAFRRMKVLELKEGRSSWKPPFQIATLRGMHHANLLRMGWKDNPPQYGHAFPQYWKLYGKEHPEYFGMRPDGVRAPFKNRLADKDDPTTVKSVTVAMCVSSDALVKQIIRNWGGKTQYVNLCENDIVGKEACRCPECRKLDAPDVGDRFDKNLADRYIAFGNRVLKEARKIRPDAKVSYYAYNQSEQPPRVTRPAPGTVIGLVPTVFDEEGTLKMIREWKKAGMTEFFWRPNQQCYFRGCLPFGYERYFFDLMKKVAAEGCIAFDYSATVNHPMTALADYVHAKFFSDPSKDYEYWETHYLEAFGPASPEIRDYYRWWQENFWNRRILPDLKKIMERGKFSAFVRGLYWSAKDYYKDSDFIVSGKFLEKAAAVKGLSREQQKRIRILSDAHEHAHLIVRTLILKTDAASMELYRYRVRNRLQILERWEQYWGDVCGLKRIQNFREYKPPYVQMPLLWFFKPDPEDAGIREKWYSLTFPEYKKWNDMMQTNAPWEGPHRYKQTSPGLRAFMKNYNGAGWYAVQNRIPREYRGRKIYLYFEAVDESCKVWVNGKYAGEHKFLKPNDWNVPFAIDITDCVDFNQEYQQFLVRVMDKENAGGIWKRVWLVSQ